MIYGKRLFILFSRGAKHLLHAGLKKKLSYTPFATFFEDYYGKYFKIVNKHYNLDTEL